jgi:hypothetical protein
MPPFTFPVRPPLTDAERRLDLMKWQLMGVPRNWLASRDLLRAPPLQQEGEGEGPSDDDGDREG